MTVEAKVLKSLVVRCLDNDPANRPKATNILEVLKELKVCSTLVRLKPFKYSLLCIKFSDSVIILNA